MAVGQFPSNQERRWAFTLPSSPVDPDGFDADNPSNVYINLNGPFPPGLYFVPQQTPPLFENVVFSTNTYNTSTQEVDRWSYGGNNQTYINLTTTVSALKTYGSSQLNLVDIGITGYIQEVSYQDGKLLVTGNGQLAQSTNGVTWSTSTAPWSVSHNRLVFGSGETEKYLVYQSNWNTNTTAYWTSTNGTTWTTRYGPAAHYLNEISYYNGNYYFAGRTTGGAAQIYSSTDGITWTQRFTTTDSTYFHKILYGAGEARPFVALAEGQGGLTNSYLKISTDGVTWANATLPAGQTASGRLYGGIYEGGSFYVYTNQSPYIMTSTDGLTWSTSGITNVNVRVAYSFHKIATDEYLYFNGTNTYHTTSLTDNNSYRLMPNRAGNTTISVEYFINLGAKLSATYLGNPYNYWFTRNGVSDGTIAVSNTLNGYINVDGAPAGTWVVERVGPTAKVES